MILKYKIFKNSENFEKWQESYTSVIHQISPMVLNVLGKCSGSEVDVEARMDTSVGLFVIYSESEKKIERKYE